MVPGPLVTLPVTKVTSRAGVLPSTRSRAPLWISNSPATVKLEPTKKFTTALVLNNSLPPTGTFTGTRTTDSAQQHAGSPNISHKPRFSTRPLPCKSNVLHRVTHRSVPRLVKMPFNCNAVPTGCSHRAPALITTLLLKTTVPPTVWSMPPGCTSIPPLKLAELALNTALLATTTNAELTDPLIERLVRIV